MTIRGKARALPKELEAQIRLGRVVALEFVAVRYTMSFNSPCTMPAYDVYNLYDVAANEVILTDVYGEALAKLSDLGVAVPRERTS